MSNITIVTAFFDIGRNNISDGLPGYLKRSNNTYFSHFSKLATLENEMVIFTSREFKEKILSLRQGKKTTLVEFDFHNKLNYIKKQITNIQNNPDFIAKVNPNQINNIEYWSSDYVILTNLKTYFVNKAIKENLVSHAQIAWVDFGYVREEKTLNHVKNWQYQFNKDKVHFFSIDKNIKTIDSFQQVNNFIFNNQVYLIGGCIVASKPKWNEFLHTLFTCQKELLKQNIIDDDQGLNIMCLWKNPDLFQVHYLGRKKWFDLFKKYDDTSKIGMIRKIKDYFGW